MPTVTETLVVQYDNAEHHRYAQLCMEFGFGLIVNAGLRVALKFVHPKGHVVHLDFDGDDPDELYDPHLFIHMRGHFYADAPGTSRDNYDTPIYPDHYSEMEWTWINLNLPNGAKPTLYDYFARELHIWLKVRPHSMNTLPQLD